MNRKQRRTLIAKGIDPMHTVKPGEAEPQADRPQVQMTTTVPAGEVPVASIMIVGAKSGQVFIGHAEGQLHAAHALCMGAAQTLYEMILRQLKKQDEQRVVPVTTPMSNLVLPPMSGRDS